MITAERLTVGQGRFHAEAITDIHIGEGILRQSQGEQFIFFNVLIAYGIAETWGIVQVDNIQIEDGGDTLPCRVRSLEFYR